MMFQFVGNMMETLAKLTDFINLRLQEMLQLATSIVLSVSALLQESVRARALTEHY
jgi:hypothetical protein